MDSRSVARALATNHYPLSTTPKGLFMAYMEVLLREDVDNVGHRGQVVRVRAGYGRNYLLPQGLAIEASAGNKRMIDEARRILAKREKRERVEAQSQAESLNGLELIFDRRVGEHDALYGSVTAHDIVEALKKLGHKIERRRVGLHEPIKHTGEFEVKIKLHRDVSPTLKLVVRNEGGEEPPAEQQPEAAPAAPENKEPAETE